MYLLMLLATFLSAIYGYNLSARPDYDRDVARKKAAAVIFKFNRQHAMAEKMYRAVVAQSGMVDTTAVPYILPDDEIYADFDMITDDFKDRHLFYSQPMQGMEPELVPLRVEAGGDVNYLVAGRLMFDKSEMGSKLVCLDKPLYLSGAKTCDMNALSDDGVTPAFKDGDGNIIGSCCDRESKYIVSFKRIDPRFINRVTMNISMDFMRGLSGQKYTANIGVINWRNNRWEALGRFQFLPVYYDDMKAWQATHEEDDPYPADFKKRNIWNLPTTVFTENYFTIDGTEMCKQTGCLFRIRNL